MKATPLVQLIIALGVAALAVACSGSNGGGSGNNDYSYNGPGSAWSVSLDEDGTFDISASETLGDDAFLTVHGDYERHANGFIELTVTSATGDDAPDPGDSAMAIEAPGFAFLLRPLDGDGEILPMVAAGGCPDDDVAANWMMMTCNDGPGESCDADDTDRDFLGVFSYDASAETATLPARYSIANGSDQGSNNIGTATCDGGVMSVEDALMYLTENEGAIVQISPEDHDNAQHVLALPRQAITQVDLAGTYVGMGFDKGDDSSFAVSMTVNGAGTSASIFQVNDEALEDATPGSSVASIAITSVNMVSTNAADGWLTGTLSVTAEPDRPIYCMNASDVGDSGKSMMLCIGQSPGDAESFYNLVMVSAD